MKKFIVRTFVFVFPIIFLLASLEFFLRNNNSSYYALKRLALDNEAASTEVLVLGSSSENSGINPEIFHLKGINLAFIGGTTVDLFHFLLKKNIRRFPSLKMVIIPISTFTFFATEEREEMKFRKILLNRYFDLYEEKFANPISRIMVYNLGLKTALKTIFIKKRININDSGFEKIEGTNTEHLTNEYGKKTVARHIGKTDEYLDFKIYERNLKILNKMIKILKQKSIEPILITTPTHRSYYKNLDVKIINIINNTVENITKHHKIKYYNYLKDDRFVDSDFYNCDHLNYNGAKKFSKILDDEVL